ncbi:MAG: M50 family metallopeptidase [bacterium]
MIYTILIFIAVLLVVVIVHEFGHYIAAKKSGMLVEEFGFGIPPRLFAVRKGETVYSFNALPMGGFVKIAGENEGVENIPESRQFEYAKWYKKVLVLVAGVCGNLLLGFTLFFFALMVGLPSASTTGQSTVLSVSPGSPAAHADVRVGDIVAGFGVGGKNQVQVIDTEHIHTFLQTQKGAVSITLERNGELVQKTIQPSVATDGSVKIGLAVEDVSRASYGWKESLSMAYHKTIEVIGMLFGVIGNLVGGLIHHKDSGASDLVGPVGIASELGGARAFGFGYILYFAGLISLNLAVLNILPFPALDGGRLFVVLIETIIGRKLPKRLIQIVHTAGFILLLGLILVLTFKDIAKLV